MEKLLGKESLGRRWTHVFRALGTSLLLAILLRGTAYGQQIPITGTVTSAGGASLRGVTVRVRGTETTATTNTAAKSTRTMR